MIAAVDIRGATAAERAALEALQRRSSDAWEAYREQLAAHPDAIALPRAFIDDGRVRVAVAGDDTPIGFSVVIPARSAMHELDGLFVEPSHMLRGISDTLHKSGALPRKVESSDIYLGSIPWVLLQLVLVGIVIAFPQTVTAFLDEEVKIDLDKVKIEAPTESGYGDKNANIDELFKTQPPADAGSAPK